MPEVKIVVQGSIDPEWSEWLEDLDILHLEPGTSRLTGFVIDQAALYGLLAKLRDLGLSLVEVKSSGFETSHHVTMEAVDSGDSEKRSSETPGPHALCECGADE